MSVETATLLFLIVFYIFAELFVWRKGLRGVVVSLDNGGDLPLVAGIERTMCVRLYGGPVVRARVAGCTACLGRFVPGDEVKLLRCGEQYVVSLPWRKCRD